MLRYYTPVEPSEFPFRITYRDSLFWLGSCFAANIGNVMKILKFKSEINPFGALYNPLSILSGMDILLKNSNLTAGDLFEHDELWSSFLFHGSFSDIDKFKTLEKMNRQIEQASTNLYSSKYLFITFGTAYVFRLKTSGEIVGNCHKLPAANFEHECLDLQEIITPYEEFITRIISLLPDLKIIFSLSPVRHLKNGTHDNQISKAILLLSIEKLVRKFPQTCFYFPAYEIVLDELRDYRFYDQDLCHISEQGIEHIKNIFINSLISKQDRAIIKEIEKLNLARSHRPFHTDTAQYLKFIENTDKKETELRKKYPYIFLDENLRKS